MHASLGLVFLCIVASKSKPESSTRHRVASCGDHDFKKKLEMGNYPRAEKGSRASADVGHADGQTTTDSVLENLLDVGVVVQKALNPET